nr:aldo/keto reductase [Planctomicrobium piriforme]
MLTQGKRVAKPLLTNPEVTGRYRLPHRLGLGCVAIGNGFAPVSDEQVEQTLEAAWATGVRYFDTSPFYGYGLSERRLGHFLHNHSPDDYVISTKVGRIFKATKQEPAPSLWKSPSPFSFEYDYTADGTRRSIEDSLQRLGVSQIDIVFIHDLAPDNFGEKWTEQFAIAAKGAMPELTRLREQGVIKAWGFGVNRPEPALRAVEVADPDLFLLACQYSLLDHQQALEKTFPVLEEKGVPVVVGAPLLAGFLAGRERYLYGGTIPPGAQEKRQQVMAIADQFKIDLRTASLQFAAAPSIVSAVIPGARTPEQVQANSQSFQVEIPAEFWATLKQKGLISQNAAVPA